MTSDRLGTRGSGKSGMVTTAPLDTWNLTRALGLLRYFCHVGFHPILSVFVTQFGLGFLCIVYILQIIIASIIDRMLGNYFGTDTALKQEFFHIELNYVQVYDEFDFNYS